MIFGCTSIDSENPDEIATMQQVFTSAKAATLTSVQPHAQHQLAGLAEATPVTGAAAEDLEERLMPALLKGYLRAGAHIAPEPSHDPHFRCVDFFTVLDLTKQVPDFYGAVCTKYFGALGGAADVHACWFVLAACLLIVLVFCQLQMLLALGIQVTATALAAMLISNHMSWLDPIICDQANYVCDFDGNSRHTVFRRICQHAGVVYLLNGGACGR